MAKTILIEEENYWDIKDAQTILEKKGIKLKLPEIMSVIIPNTEDIVKKIEEEKTKIYIEKRRGDGAEKLTSISVESATKILEREDNSISEVKMVFKRSIHGIEYIYNKEDIYYEINVDESNHGGDVCFMYIPEKIIDKFRDYITEHNVVNQCFVKRV